MRPARLNLPAFCFCGDLQHLVKKDGRYTCEPFEFAIASLDEVFVFHLGIVNFQDIFARGLLSNIPGIVRPNLVSENMLSTQKYDVFISHSSEDKDEVARPLAEALQKLGLKVWYDEFTLKIGDSLRRSIDNGLANSQIGLVILSPSFVKKDWTNHELDGIITRSMNNQQLLLPIWHRISKEEVINYSPSLADKLARNTATHTIAEIASEISEFFKRKD